jgi:hypothetical protein
MGTAMREIMLQSWTNSNMADFQWAIIKWMSRWKMSAT